jgi:hypothetical protein
MRSRRWRTRLGMQHKSGAQASYFIMLFIKCPGSRADGPSQAFWLANLEAWLASCSCCLAGMPADCAMRTAVVLLRLDIHLYCHTGWPGPRQAMLLIRQALLAEPKAAAA